MKNFLTRSFGIVAALGTFALAFWLTSLVTDRPTSSTSSDATPSEPATTKLTKEQYLRVAIPNCVAEGLPKDYCQKGYQCLLDTYGVEETYRLDKTASSSPKGQVPDEVVNKLAVCS